MTKISYVKVFLARDEQPQIAAAIYRGAKEHSYYISKESARRMANLIYKLMDQGKANVRPFLADVGFVAYISREGG